RKYHLLTRPDITSDETTRCVRKIIDCRRCRISHACGTALWKRTSRTSETPGCGSLNGCVNQEVWGVHIGGISSSTPKCGRLSTARSLISTHCSGACQWQRRLYSKCLSGSRCLSVGPT